MGVPKQVEEAANEAEEYLKSLGAQDEAQTEEGDTTTTVTTEPEDTSEQQEEPAQEEPSEPKEDFEAKYRTLKGKYEAEVPRLQNELKEFKQSVIDRIGDTAQQPQVEEETEDPSLAKFKESFTGEFGEELLGYLEEFYELKSKSAVKEQVDNAIKPLEEKVTSVEDSQIESAQEEFSNYLDEHVNGNWQEAADDPEFLKFLDQPDPSGLYTYRDLVAAYNQNWEQEKLAKVLNIYYGEKGTTEKQPEAKPENKAKEAIIAPSRSNSAEVPVDETKPIWTQESFKEFQRKDRRGDYSSEESLRLWNDVMIAPSEGRFR